MAGGRQRDPSNWRQEGGVWWRLCKPCGEWKQHTIAHFSHDVKGCDRLRVVCRPCGAKIARESEQRRAAILAGNAAPADVWPAQAVIRAPGMPPPIPALGAAQQAAADAWRPVNNSSPRA